MENNETNIESITASDSNQAENPNRAENPKKGFDFSSLVNQAQNVGAAILDNAQKAGKVASDTASQAVNVANDLYDNRPKPDIPDDTTYRDVNGHYLLPDPILDEKELAKIPALAKQYQDMTKPKGLAKIGKSIGEIIPQSAKDMAKEMGDNLADQQVYKRALEVIASSFKMIEEQASRMTISPESVIHNLNENLKDGEISKIKEIPLLRSYEVAQVVDEQKKYYLSSAAVEGAAIGLVGFAGIPFSLVLSTFLYYRAVQSIALYYGYDVKSDPAELIIASEVFMGAMSLGSNVSNGKADIVKKIMLIAELQGMQQTVKKSWAEMARRGGLALLAVQIRALANKSAQKALNQAGRKSLEKHAFHRVFEQLGKKLTQKNLGRVIPVVGGVAGAAFDTQIMNQIVTYANMFYHKRFIAEKELRLQALVEGVSVDEVTGASYEEVLNSLDEDPEDVFEMADIEDDMESE